MVRRHAQEQGWELLEENIFRDDGYSGTTLARPALDASLLSKREIEVLVLVAEGLTNPQVAQGLYLSPRTVGQHLRSIYRKLGVSSRAAAREAVDRRLI